MKRTTAILFLLLAAFPLCLFAQLTPEVRQKTFEKVWQTVDENFFDPTFGGVDWKASRETYGRQVPAMKADAEFYALLAKMLGELKTSHLSILTPETIARMKQPPVVVGVGFRELDGRIVITRVLERSSAAESGLKTGYVITNVDGAPVTTFTEVQIKLSTGAPGSRVSLSYLDAKDESHDITLERRPVGGDNKTKIGGVSFYGLIDSDRLTGNIGYVKFSGFLDALDPQIRSAVKSMSDAAGMVIDLRGNAGGEDSVALNLANLFFDKETQLMITKTRKGDKLDYKVSGSKDAFRGPIAILVDDYSMSQSEQFSAGMQAAGRAIVVGKNTPGADLDADVTRLPDGSMFIYAVGQTRTPKGYVIEGHGVKPDIEVSLTRKDLLAGRDSQLEAAIAYVKSRQK